MAKKKARSNEQEQARCLEFFKRLDFSKVEAAYQKALDLSADPWTAVDGVYRVFHHSFKMYTRFNDATYRYLTYMLEPLYHHAHSIHKTKECDNANIAFDQVIYELDYWYMHSFLMSFVKASKDAKFTLARNEKELWCADARDLTSTYFFARQICLSTLETMRAMGKKEGFLWLEKPVILSEDESLFLETWESVGSVLRYGAWRNDPKLEDEIRAIISEKVK